MGYIKWPHKMATFWCRRNIFISYFPARYRCVCRCDGSWECPARHTINLCEHSPSQPSRGQGHLTPRSDLPVSAPLSHSADTNGQRCRMCLVNLDTHPGNTYFSYVDGCIAFRNCFCHCNSSWACPEEAATDLCSGKTPQVSREAGRLAARDIQLGKEQVLSVTTSSDASLGVKHHNDTEGPSLAKKVYSRCVDCTAGGKIIKGNNYFELVEGCRKLSYCTCFCNGTWICPERFAEDICEADTPEVTTKVRSACGSCSVKGRTFPGNSYFQLTDGCVQYQHCVCYCDGTWACPESKSISNCTRGEGIATRETTQPTCRHCTVQGKVIEAQEYFHLREGCLEYRHCVCQCNGSWSCAKDAALNVCSHENEARGNTSACLSCSAYGSVFPGGQYFQVKHGCTEHRNCLCYCNGSWDCPKDSTRNVCDERQGVLLKQTGIGDPEVSETRCLTCLAYGKYFKGDSNFDVIDRCMSYRKCVCRCDGSWDCNDRFAVNICSNSTLKVADSGDVAENRADTNAARETAADTRLNDNQCSFCDARNKVITGNSLFELTDGCFEYRNCLCRCDGSWECPPQFAKNICDENNQTKLLGADVALACAICVAKGRIIRGGSGFELVDGCILYKSCHCECTGKWDCSTDRVEDVCSVNGTAAGQACSLCQPSPGVLHPANSWFKLTDNCVQHSCMCFCNGSWSCPAHYNRWICEDQCLQCDVDGEIVANNTQFIHRTGCLEHTCTCHCNGTWSCPKDATRDVCAQTGSHDCGQCKVSGSHVYPGDSEFVLQQGCLHYKCRCNCDGSYFCPGKDARNTCRGEVIGGCRTCVLSGTEIHKGETDFVLRRGCVFYNCTCNCDGSWQCPAERSRNVCLGEIPGGCRVCRVTDTENYRANSFFDFRKGCISYRCKCNCDGSWSCLGKDARDICKGEVPGGCKSCLISDQEYYRGNSDFETLRDCVRYKCRCNCDGTYTCPGYTAKRVCQTGAQIVAAVCKPCRVSATEMFAGNSTFTFNRDCSRFQCECKCDGSWECPPAKTMSTCDSRAPASFARCKVCRIADKVFPGSTEFKFNRGCFQFDCKCACSGRWSCDTQNLTNVCREREQTITERPLVSAAKDVGSIASIDVPAPLQVISEGSISGNTIIEPDIQGQETDNSQDGIPNNISEGSTTRMMDSGNASNTRCQSCYVDGRNIRADEEFVLFRGCVEYRACRCYCNGRWQCSDITNKCTTNPASDENVYIKDVTASPMFTKSTKTEATASILAGADFHPGRQTHVEDGYLSDQGVVGRNGANRGMQHSQSPEKRYINGSKKFKSPDPCIGCEVRGVSYNERSRFVLRDGCRQRECQCYCDGSWSCVESKVDICKVETKDQVKALCKNCQIGSDVYISERDFQMNSGCYQYNCHCFCNGSYDCPTDRRQNSCPQNIRYDLSRSLNVVKSSELQDQPVISTKENGNGIMSSQVPGCKHCQENGKQLQSLTSFTKLIGCYQVTCFCQCNGIPSCPTSSFVNICRGPGERSSSERTGT